METEALLDGVQKFLKEQVVPKIEDRGVGFRVKVALYILGTLERRIQLGAHHTELETERLRDILGHSALKTDLSTPANMDLDALKMELAQSIRNGHWDHDDSTLRNSLMASLRDELQIVKPRFDTRVNLETSVSPKRAEPLG